MAEDRIGRASLLLASGTLVSRALGFVKIIVLAAVIGVYRSESGDAFATANGLPSILFAIVAGGVLSAVLVPQIVRAATHDDGGSAYIDKLLTLALVLILGATVVATLAAPLIVTLYAGSNTELIPLATAFAYWSLPQIFFYGLYALLGEVLNARRSFGPYTWVPALNNVVAIAGFLVFGFLYGFDRDGARTPSDWTPDMIALLAGSATLGIAVQALSLLWFWRRIGLRYRPDFRWRGVGLGSAGRMAGWTFGMLLLTTGAGIVQSNVALVASGSGASASTIDTAWLLFMLPHSIITVSLATAYFTRMSEHGRDGRLDELREDLSSAVRTVSVLLLLASAVLIVAAYPVAAIFQPGFRSASGIGNVIIAFALGLLAFSTLFIVQRTFYALGDTRTPFFYTIVQTVLFTVLALSCLLLPVEWIGVGLALSTTLACIVQLVIAVVVLRRRIHGLDGRRVAVSLARNLAALVVPVALGVLVLIALGGTSEGGFGVSSVVGGVVTSVAVGAVMALGYLAGLWLLRSPELTAAAGPLIARFRR